MAYRARRKMHTVYRARQKSQCEDLRGDTYNFILKVEPTPNDIFSPANFVLLKASSNKVTNWRQSVQTQESMGSTTQG